MRAQDNGCKQSPEEEGLVCSARFECWISSLLHHETFPPLERKIPRAIRVVNQASNSKMSSAGWVGLSCFGAVLGRQLMGQWPGTGTATSGICNWKWLLTGEEFQLQDEQLCPSPEVTKPTQKAGGVCAAAGYAQSALSRLKSMAGFGRTNPKKAEGDFPILAWCNKKKIPMYPDTTSFLVALCSAFPHISPPRKARCSSPDFPGHWSSCHLVSTSAKILMAFHLSLFLI